MLGIKSPNDNNMEILLDSKSMCNLTTVNLMAFVREDNTLDVDGVIEAQRLSARAGYRMANIELELSEWDKNLRENRLVGTSITGLQDMINSVGLTDEELIDLYKRMRSAVHEEVKAYAELLGEVTPDAMTTIKPEGSLSTIPTVSPGIHYPESEYYIRRVRVSAADPLCKLSEELGYPVFPEVGSTEENATTKVVEFALKSPLGSKGKTKQNVSAIEQLENYKMSMTYFTDHNTSITVSVRESEWDDVEEWMYNNWDGIVGISFLPLEDAVYPLMPYEAISKEEYERRINEVEIRTFDSDMLRKYEGEELEEEDLMDDPACASGVCPIR